MKDPQDVLDPNRSRAQHYSPVLVSRFDNLCRRLVLISQSRPGFESQRILGLTQRLQILGNTKACLHDISRSTNIECAADPGMPCIALEADQIDKRRMVQ